MKISPRVYAISLHQVLKDQPPQKHAAVIKNFLKLLRKNRDLKILDRVVSELDHYLDEISRRGEVEIISAHPLSEKVKREIQKMIKEELAVKEVRLKERLDKQLIGGLILNWNDRIFDGSVKNRLTQLKKILAR